VIPLDVDDRRDEETGKPDRHTENACDHEPYLDSEPIAHRAGECEPDGGGDREEASEKRELRCTAADVGQLLSRPDGEERGFPA